MITFGIPLKGSSASSNWDKVCALFFRTLVSAAAQKNDAWRLVVACDEIPPLPEWVRAEERIDFIAMKHIESIAPLDDKGRKVNAIAHWHRNRGGVSHAPRCR